jgi:hypothetical protein
VVPQGEVSVETSPLGERLSSAWKYRRDLGRQRRELRDDVSVDFVVEWQLQPLETETASSDSPRIHVQDLSAYPG